MTLEQLIQTTNARVTVSIPVEKWLGWHDTYWYVYKAKPRRDAICLYEGTTLTEAIKAFTEEG